MPKLTIQSLALTQAIVARAAAGSTTQDTKQSALRLVVSPKGKAVWQFYAWDPIAKRPRMKKVGDAGDGGMAVEVARREVVKLLAAMTAPEAQEKAAATSKVPTLGVIVDDASSAFLTEKVNLNFNDWRTKRLDEITPEMVAARREVILRRARAESLARNPDQKDPGMATLGLAAKALRQVYTQAQERGLYKGENAGQWLPLHKGSVRRVWLKDDDMLLDLIELLDDCEGNGLPAWAKPYYLLQIFTGTRGGVLAKARWSWVDWSAKEIHLPNEDVKNDEPHVLHLDLGGDAALKLLREWQAATAERKSPFIFPSVRDADKHMTNMHGNGWVKVREALGWDDINPHDLRRTFGSRLLNAGTSIEVVSKLLGHKSIAVTQKVYAHLLAKTVKAAVVAAPLPQRAS